MDDKTGMVLDGYQLVRPLGRGGFGEVWLCRSLAMGDFRAIKLISTGDPAKVAREHSAMLRYRAAAGLDSRHLVPVEHINLDERALYYVMPLADGTGGAGPEDPAWEPLTLHALIEAKRREGVWFSSGEIVGLISPVLLALQTLLDAGLVHGDVKPSNVLLFHGFPRLADLGLLDDDRLSRTRAGTPVFSAPSWYGGGLSDMYSAAATLHVLLTGNDPDTLGRSAFRWPPPGQESLSPSERDEWLRLHAVVRRGVAERVQERYPDFAAMLEAVEGGSSAGPPPAPEPLAAPGGSARKGWVATLAMAALAGVGGLAKLLAPKEEIPTPPPAETSGEQELTEEQEDDYRIKAGMIASYAQSGDAVRTLAMVDSLWTAYPQSRSQPAYSIYRAMALRDLGRIEEAKEELRKAVHVSPRIEAMTLRIDLWESLGDLEEAELSQTRILEAYGPNTLALAFRAEVRAKRGDYAGVEADRLAALPLNPDAPEMQRRYVATMWNGLAKKYPGYAEHLGEKGLEEALLDESRNPADPWVIECLDDILDDLLAEDASLSEQANAARSKLRDRMIDDFGRRHYEYSLVMLDRLTMPESGGGGRPIPPVMVKTPVLSLYRALLLDRLHRQAEVAEELRGYRDDDLSPRQAESRAALLVALSWEEEAESLLTRMMAALPSDGGRGATETRIELLELRARVRAVRGEYAGVRGDHAEAFRLAGGLDSQDGGGSDLRRSVGQARRELAERFPDYADYLAKQGDAPAEIFEGDFSLSPE